MNMKTTQTPTPRHTKGGGEEEGANGFSTVSALAEKLTDDHMCEKRRVSTTKVFETWAGKK